MGVLDDVILNAKSAAEAVGKKAGQIVDSSKIRIGISELNSEISKCYQVIGQYVHENCKELLADDENAMGVISAIDTAIEQREVLKKELLDMQNKSVCHNCGVETAIEQSFCSSCGTKLGE